MTMISVRRNRKLLMLTFGEGGAGRSPCPNTFPRLIINIIITRSSKPSSTSSSKLSPTSSLPVAASHVLWPVPSAVCPYVLCPLSCALSWARCPKSHTHPIQLSFEPTNQWESLQSIANQKENMTTQNEIANLPQEKKLEIVLFRDCLVWMNACDTVSFVTVSPGEEKYAPPTLPQSFTPPSSFKTG